VEGMKMTEVSTRTTDLIFALNEKAKIFRRLDKDLTDTSEHFILARKFYSLIEEAYQISIQIDKWAQQEVKKA